MSKMKDINIDSNLQQLKDASHLSDNDLSDLLVQMGFPRTPVTGFTRKYLENQLMTKLQGAQRVRGGTDSPLNGVDQKQPCRELLESRAMMMVTGGGGHLSPVTPDSPVAHLKHGNGSLSPPKHTPTFEPNLRTENTTFYAVFCPEQRVGGSFLQHDGPDDSRDVEETAEPPESRVFAKQEDALNFAKQNKKSRFKSFKNYFDALNFSRMGVNINGSNCNSPSQPVSSPITDGVSRFKGPKSQDLVKLRKAIEGGDVSDVRRKVWENPRYLVGSGDTPSILQEGARYNALHIAAKVMNHEMVSLLLETISDVNFIQLLYGIEAKENCRQRANFLLDLYLNTPDKGLNETPLHLAVKFGAVSVVEVLVSYPECDRTRPNKYLQTPQQMICSRMSSPPKETVHAIEQLLKGSYFVPVLRSLAAESQPVVGDPFSCMAPLVANSDPLSPKMDVTAYAGPMDMEQAQCFRRRWKTPPRPKASLLSLSVARLTDLERGLEREGRDLAKQFHIKWKEYWSFLGIYTDFGTPEGISKLEECLKVKFEAMSKEVLQEEHIKNYQNDQATTTESKMPESPSSRPPTTPDKVEKTGIPSVSPMSPMSDLCAALSSCTLDDVTPQPRRPVLKEPAPCVEPVTTSLSPIMYIEKTCHVLARRLAEGMGHSVQNCEGLVPCSGSLKEVLLAEVTNMTKLINSFRASPCFGQINFQLIHSRIAMLIPHFLDDLTQSYDLTRICNSLQMLTSAVRNDESSEEEEDRDRSGGFRAQPARTAPLRLGEQVACLAQLVIHALSRPGGRAISLLADKEPAVVALWGRCSECSCSWSNSPSLSRALRRGSSLKRGVARQLVLPREPPVQQQQERKTYVWSRQEAAQVVQRLPSEEADEESETSESEDTRPEAEGGETDAFYTPPSSVTSESPDLEDFECPLEGYPVYLDGKVPTKLDVDVLRALDQQLLNAEQYPNIWRWRHQLMQFTEQQRDCLPSPAQLQRMSSPASTASPTTPVSSRRVPLSPLQSPVSHRRPSGAMWGSPEPPFSSPRRRIDL